MNTYLAGRRKVGERDTNTNFLCCPLRRRRGGGGGGMRGEGRRRKQEEGRMGESKGEGKGKNK